MPKLYINNEYSKLKKVILGSPRSFGGTPLLRETYDPKSREHIKNGTFPTQEDISKEMEDFSTVLQENGVEVLRPTTIENYNQIFSRDIGCVIENKFLIANIIKDRALEIQAVEHIMESMTESHIIKAPNGVRFEGGDVLVHNDYIFIGYSQAEDFEKFKVSRTNQEGVDFIKENFPNKAVVAFQLNKSDDDPKENALHLDCCFSPLGLGHAIIHKEGFKVASELNWLISYIGEENCLFIDKDQMYEMGANLFSIAPDHVISDKRFTAINTFLKSKGYQVTEIKYEEIAKMEGLLRCSTLPLLRE